MKKNYLLIGCLFILTGMQINAQTKTSLNDVPAFNCDYRVLNGLDASAKVDRTDQTARLIGYLELNGQKCIVDQGSASRKSIYIDKTATVIKVKRGATYSLKMQNSGFSWMHTSLWIDYDKNSLFNKEAGYTVDSGSELVSFDYFSTNAESNQVRGVNSRGTQFSTDDARAGQQGVVNGIFTLPQFTIPVDATLGQTRMRFTCNWGSIDPSGLLPANSVGTAPNSPAKVNATIVDVTLEIEENTSSVIFEQPLTGGTFKIKKGESQIASNDKLPAGTELTVETIPAEGYHLLAIKVNGTTIVGNTFTLGSMDTTVTVEYIANTSAIFTLTSGANGSLSVVKITEGKEVAINSGDIIDSGTEIKVTATPNDKYLLGAVKINNEDKTDACIGGSYTFTSTNMNTTIEATFIKDPNIKEDYCTPNINRNSGDRYLSALKIEGATYEGETQSFSSTLFSGNQAKVYVDRTNEILKATVGDELTLSYTKKSLEWMHFYVYIDYNNDGIFDTDTELVSYTFLSNTADSPDGKDSKEVARTNSYCPDACPSFIIPANITPGETRLRLKVDWNNANPCGDAKIGENRGTIIDYTINLQKGVYNVTFEQPENGYGTFKVLNGEKEITSGSEIDNGTVLTVETTPLSEAYDVKAILVNDKVITGNTFTVANDSKIVVEFIKGRLISYTVSEGGTFVVKKGDTTIENNTPVDLNSELKLSLKADTGYELSSFTVDGTEMKNEVGADGMYTISSVNKSTVFNVVFTKVNYKFSYSFNELGTVKVQNNGVTVENEKMIPYNTNLSISVNPGTQCYVKSILLNGEEKKDELLINGNNFTLTITKEISLEVIFDATKYTLISNTPLYGTLEVKNEAEEAIASGAEVPYSALLDLTLTPVSDNTLTNLLINDGTGEIDYAEADGYIEFADGKYTTQIQVFGNVTISATFSIPTDIHNTMMENCNVYSTKEGNIVIENAEIGSTIEVYNTTGQTVKKQTVASNQEVISGISSNKSVYLVRISNGSETMIKKIIKE